MEWLYGPSCGECPQRRATDHEAMSADEALEPLPRCLKCGHPLMPAIGVMAPHIDSYTRLVCLDCTQKRKLTCQHPKHFGASLITEHLSTKYAVPGTSHKNSHRKYRKVCCYKCAKRYSLETWLDFSLRKGNVDLITGEIKELPDESEDYSLTAGYVQLDPMHEHGGMEVCWCPTKGIEGTYRVVNGQRFNVWIAFQPRKFTYITFKEKNTRVLKVLRYNPDSLLPDGGNTTLGTIWHSGVNAWIDSVLGTKDSPRAKNPAPMGWSYVRITGVNQTGTHTLFTSRYTDNDHDSSGHKSIREWVEWCHNQ